MLQGGAALECCGEAIGERLILQNGALGPRARRQAGLVAVRVGSGSVECLGLHTTDAMAVATLAAGDGAPRTTLLRAGAGGVASQVWVYPR